MLQSHTAEPVLVRTLKQLMATPFLNDFYLVGGTGLALQIGHRNSIDIDLFTHLDYSPETLTEELTDFFSDAFQKTGNNKSMLFSYINDVKVDFVNNKTPLLYPLNVIEGIRIADIKDIAPLKLKAIFGRGSKKDFVDLYALLQQFEVDELIHLFKQKFPSLEVGQLLISMYYFGDAEQDAMPKLYINVNWEEIKNYIAEKIMGYLKK